MGLRSWAYGFLGLCCLALSWGIPPARAVPGKTYSDLTLSNQNSDHITGAVLFDPAGIDEYAALGINDSTAYSPDKIFTNTGDITLTNYTNSVTNLLSVFVNDNSRVMIRNSGNITLTHSGGDNAYWCNGIVTEGSMENSGNLSISFQKQNIHPSFAVAYGITVKGSTFTNAGEVNINVTGSTSNTNTNSAFALASGISFSGSTMTNSGDISVTATGGYTTNTSTSGQSYAYGMTVKGSLVNTGEITANAVAGKYRANASSPWIGGDANAYGLYVSGSLALDSRGLIHTSVSRTPGISGGTLNSKQLYVHAGTTTISGYAMRLSNQSQFNSVYTGTIKVNSGAGVAFNNAVLYLCTCNNFSGEAEYEIPMLVEGAAAADQFASIAPMPAEYQVALVDGNGAGLQKLKFTYAPQDDPALMSTEIMNAFDARQHQMIGSNVSNSMIRNLIPARDVELNAMDSPAMLMAHAGSAASPIPGLARAGRNHTFAGPVVLSAKDTSDSGYDAQTQGLLAGYTRHIRDDFYVGGHGSVTNVDIHFTGAGADRRYHDTRSYSLGGHLVYLTDETWLFSGLASLFYGQTDYRDEAPTNVENASYDSYTGLLEFNLGRLTQVGDYILVPEVGISGVWNSREAFTTDNQVNADVHHGAMEEVEVYGKLGVEGYARFELDAGVEVMPNVGVGITRTLTDGASEAGMSLAQVHRTVTHHSQRTTVDASAGITLEQENVSLLAGTTASFTRHSRNYLFWLELGVAF